MRAAERWRVLLPALWAGLLLAVALIATSAPFATLVSGDAGRVVARVFAHEAYLSLACGAIVLLLERMAAKRAAQQGGSQFSTPMVLALGAIFCTVAGHFGLQPLVAAARGGQGALSFGQLHALAVAFFALKTVFVLALAWQAAGAPASLRPPPSS
jgi:Domain of unknown function (DUF4149)